MAPLRAAAAAAAGLAAYSFYEPYRFRLQRHELRYDRDVPPITLLHLGDTHFPGPQRAKSTFLRSLPERLGELPDLVIATGDMIETNTGIGPFLEAIEPIKGRLGKFYVFGSHDYYQSRFKSPTKYFTGKRGGVIESKPADVARMTKGLEEQGWVSLINRTELVGSEYGTIRLAGIDDPYLDRHDTSHLARTNDEVLAIGLMHGPDVVSEWFVTGFDLVVAGHTHGGQVRLPFAGAVVTNSTLPTALASGPSRVGGGLLHVSPGLGSSKFTPIRFLCRPEATLLQLRGSS